MTAPRVLSADLSAEDQVRFRGFLDSGDPGAGFNGWVVDTGNPQQTVSVELCAGGAVLAKKRANVQREDIRLLGRGWSRVGFHFSAEDVRALVVDRAVPADARLWVRVAGTGFALRFGKPVASPADFLALDLSGAAADAPAGPAAAPPEPGAAAPGNPPEPLSAAAAARDLPAALEAMSARAADLLRLPLTPSSERIAGYIECVSWEREGLAWVFGWARSQLPLHAPAVVADGAKYPSALAVATYARDDLPKGAHGVAGLLKTNWRPGGRAGTPLLFVGEAAEACIPLVEKPRFYTAAECAERLEALRPGLGGPFAKPLLRSFGAAGNWAPDNGRLSGAAVEACADKVLVLPGFGCLVEGWALSPLREVRGFMLRVGDSVLEAEPRSTGRKPRPDLAAAAPSGERMAESAGFVAAFTGEVEGEDHGEIVLKVLCEGGVSTNHKVDPASIRVLGASASFEEVLRIFPSVRAESFFPELARRMSEETRRAVSRPVAFEVNAAEGALAVAVPDDRSDMALLFSELAFAAQRRGGRLPPVVALARAGRHRADALALFDDLRRALSPSSSLFFVPDPAYAIHLLDGVLGRVGASRFAFVAPGVFPTDAGWDLLLDRLEGRGEGLVFLPVEGIADGSAPAAEAAPPAECFAWDRPAFAAWAARTPVFLGGTGSRMLALPAEARAASAGVLAKRGRRAPPSVLAAWVNGHLSENRAEAPPHG